MMSACGATLSSAAVDAPVPQPASSNRKPAALVGQAQSLCRKAKVGMVSRAGADEAVVGASADVKRGRHVSAGQTGVTDAHVVVPRAAGRR